MTAISELVRNEVEPNPQELDAQSEAIRNRVTEFFKGIDTSKPGRYKKGLFDIEVQDYPFGGSRMVTAIINGFVPAAMVIIDPTIGIGDPYYRRRSVEVEGHKATYKLKGETGFAHDIPCEAFVVIYDSGMELGTQLGRHGKTKEVKHISGIVPRHLSGFATIQPYLPRAEEISILKDLGVKV